MCAVVTLLGLDIIATGQLGGGERALAVVRSIVLPGLPFLEWNVPLGLVTIAIAIASIGAWLRWGIDWLPALVMIIAVATAAFVMPLHHTHSEPGERHALRDHARAQGPVRTLAMSLARRPEHGETVGSIVVQEPLRRPRTGWIEASHEFTIVLVVFAFLARLRLLFDRLPGAAWLGRRVPAAWLFQAVNVARAAALSLHAGARHAVSDSLLQPRLLARAARVNRWSRCRNRGDPLRGAHAPLRAALAMAGLLDEAQIAQLRGDARASLAGVPASEPTWVRPLDGMLAACALDALGETECVQRWRSVFRARFALRHGRRPAALHLPSMLGIGAAPAWEHAAATALGHQMGWVGVDDWTHLRPRCLGSAAGGARDCETLRLIAAGKLWAQMLNDQEALAILGRRTIASDAIARALEALAARARSAVTT